MLPASISAASSQEMKDPRISLVNPEWEAVVAELDALASSTRGVENDDGEGRQLPGSALDRLNAATRSEFTSISESPIPVLLPFNTSDFLRERAAPGSKPPSAARNRDYPPAFKIAFFNAGPGGYDAIVVALPKDRGQKGIGYSTPVYVRISGFSFLYELPEPTGVTELAVKLSGQPAAAHRILLEDSLRYSFVRYGVPYAISIECFDGGSRYARISCRDADRVAGRVLGSLRLVGGMPDHARAIVPAGLVDRPTAPSTGFTYYGPGNLLPGTGFKNKGGTVDYTVFSRIRFPLARAPAFANSQSFMNAGDCESTGWLGAGMRDGVAAYRCRVNAELRVLDEGAGKNYSYPWRDNFCETRYFQTGQCPAGLGHQGQDIRPAFCRQRNPGDRCYPFIHDVVAIRDGKVVRLPGQGSLQLIVNSADLRARVRYFHMSPKELDAHGLFTGRSVHEGEVIGTLGNFLRPNAVTTAHLHFELEVPSKDGWVLVNPYMTLVASYERLIERRGREIEGDINADAQTGPVISKTSSSSVAGTAGNIAKGR
jgi:hypothetical protein